MIIAKKLVKITVTRTIVGKTRKEGKCEVILRKNIEKKNAK